MLAEPVGHGALRTEPVFCKELVLLMPASKVNTLLAWRSDYTSAKLDTLREMLQS